jgi:putative Holliday junction resolvase
MSIIALDHGAKRIGVAAGDTETGMAFARAAIKRRSLEHDLARVVELCTDEGAELVVVGLPLNLDGSEGPQAAVVRAFGEALRGAGLAILYEDERLTSWEAERQLASGGRTPDRRTGEVDSAAAQLILQQYLDAQPAQPAEASRSAEETE